MRSSTTSGRPMWSLVAEAWRAAARSTDDQPSAAFIAVLDGDAADVQAAWAPLHAREPSWNDPWVPYGLGLPPDARATRTEVKATVAGYLASLPDRSNRVYTVTGSDGEIVLMETDGLASAHDGALDSALAFTSRRFCVDGDCICPPGTRHAGEHMADEDMHLPFVVAFNAPAGGAAPADLEQDDGAGMRSRRAITRSLAVDASKRQAAGRDRPQAAALRPAMCEQQRRSPHADRRRGSVRLPGRRRVHAARDPDGAVDVQVRQEPRLAWSGASVSNTTAVAARVGDHRVGIYARRPASSCAWTA